MSGSGSGGAVELDRTVIAAQLEHFRKADPPCRGVPLPDGVLLRPVGTASLYFYLQTVIENGAIRTQVFASDSPYDRQKASLGLVVTPMFAERADETHLAKVEPLVREWTEFVGTQPGDDPNPRPPGPGR